MKSRLIALIISLLVGLSCVSQTFSEGRDGLWLLDMCKKGLREVDNGFSYTPNYNYCLHYVDGLTDMYALNQLAYELNQFCTPRGATPEQSARIIVKYLDSNPNRLHLPASILVSFALMKAWPCKKISNVK